MDVKVHWDCPHCKQETEIHVDVESPSDYYPDLACEHCGKEIRDDKLDIEIMEEASDCFVRAADFRD
jgi:phage terminase large subunit GpA-like protein